MARGPLRSAGGNCDGQADGEHLSHISNVSDKVFIVSEGKFCLLVCHRRRWLLSESELGPANATVGIQWEIYGAWREDSAP